MSSGNFYLFIFIWPHSVPSFCESSRTKRSQLIINVCSGKIYAWQFHHESAEIRHADSSQVKMYQHTFFPTSGESSLERHAWKSIPPLPSQFNSVRVFMNVGTRVHGNVTPAHWNKSPVKVCWELSQGTQPLVDSQKPDPGFWGQAFLPPPPPWVRFRVRVGLALREV